MQRFHVFDRRARLYDELDRRVQRWTRFFGAAALVNSALSDLFRYAPEPAFRDAFELLNLAGGVLQAANLAWSRDLQASTIVGADLDWILVNREQRLLQTFIESNCAVHICRGFGVNRLLNQSPCAFWGALCLMRSRRFMHVLRSVRQDVGTRLDFYSERHRIELGLALVTDLRMRGPQVQRTSGLWLQGASDTA